MSGKGSAPRPFDVPREDYDASFDRIFGKRERKEYVPPPLSVDARVEQIREDIREGIIWSLTYDPRKEQPKEPPCPAD